MKISIEIEVAPEEIPQATELFRILRAITQNVKARAPDNLYKALVARLGDPAVGEAAVPEVWSFSFPIELENLLEKLVFFFFSTKIR
jgi:hypothetical protein